MHNDTDNGSKDKLKTGSFLFVMKILGDATPGTSMTMMNRNSKSASWNDKVDLGVYLWRIE